MCGLGGLVLPAGSLPSECSSFARAVPGHPVACPLLCPEARVAHGPEHRKQAYAFDALTNYDWPGNIRELQNVIERSVVLSDGPELHVVLPELDCEPASVVLHVRSSNVTDISERARILQVLKETKGVGGGANGAAAKPGAEADGLAITHREI